jgi:hypothetical protein
MLRNYSEMFPAARYCAGIAAGHALDQVLSVGAGFSLSVPVFVIGTQPAASELTVVIITQRTLERLRRAGSGTAASEDPRGKADISLSDCRWQVD